MSLEAQVHANKMSPKKKAQVAIEFLVILSLLLIIFVTILYSFTKGTKALSQDVWSYEAQRLVDEFGASIERVYVAGSGSSEVVTLPPYILGGVNYTMHVYPHLATIYVPVYNREFDKKLVTARIFGSLDGLYVNKTDNLVTNRNGTIFILPS